MSQDTKKSVSKAMETMEERYELAMSEASSTIKALESKVVELTNLLQNINEAKNKALRDLSAAQVERDQYRVVAHDAQVERNALLKACAAFGGSRVDD